MGNEKSFLKEALESLLKDKIVGKISKSCGKGLFKQVLTFLKVLFRNLFKRPFLGVLSFLKALLKGNM